MTSCGGRNAGFIKFGGEIEIGVEARLLDSKIVACPFWSYRNRLTFLIAWKSTSELAHTHVYISHSAPQSFH